MVVVRPNVETERVDELRAAVTRVREQGHDVQVRLTFEEGDGERFAREAARTGAELVVAAGGDGTLNEVVNGVADSPARPRVGVVPIGTANDFAVGMSVPEEIGPAVDLALTGTPRRVDLVRLNGRYFINVSAGGFGAEATEAAAPEAKRLVGAWAYVITGARQFADLRAVAGRFESEEGVLYEGEFMLFAVGNARQTGGGSMLTPRAELDDGLMDLLVVKAVPRVDFLALLPDLRAGTHLESPDVVYARARRLVLTTRETLSVNADGEPQRGSRFEYEVEPSALEVVGPP